MKADWTAVLLEGAAGVLAAVTVLASVLVGARIYREGVKDRPADAGLWRRVLSGDDPGADDDQADDDDPAP
jgi:hypothetical protein